MYFLRSSFSLESFDDLKILQKLYRTSTGSLTVSLPDGTEKKISGKDPFYRIELKEEDYPAKIETCLNGVLTLQVLCFKLRKVSKLYDNPLIAKWANAVDTVMSQHENQACLIPNVPIEKLPDMSYVFKVAQATRHAAYFTPIGNGIIIVDKFFRSVLSLQKDDINYCSAMFDKDDGLTNVPVSNEIHSVLMTWKNSGYKKEYMDYFPELADVIFKRE